MNFPPNTNNVFKWEREEKYDLSLKIAMFLISPVLGILFSLYRINTRSSFSILFMAFTLTGAAMVTNNYAGEWSNYDIFSYRSWFENVATYNWLQFKEILSDYFAGDGAHDVIIYLFYFLVSRFTSNYHIVFGVIAMVMAYFMLKSLRYLVSENNYRFGISCLFLLFIFTIAQIQKIAVFRFYIAYWVAIYAIFQIFISKNRRYYILLLLTPLFHGSFVVIYVILGIYVVIVSKPILSVAVVIGALVFGSFANDITMMVLNFLPSNLGSHYVAYLDEFYIHRINESGSGLIWVRRLMDKILFLSAPFAVLIFGRFYKSNIHESKCDKLYFLLMAFVSFVCFTINIPSLGSRYLMFVFPISAYIILVCFYENKFRNLIYLWGSYLLFCVLSTLTIYQVPDLNTWMALWEPTFFICSPIYSFLKYIVLL